MVFAYQTAQIAQFGSVAFPKVAFCEVAVVGTVATVVAEVAAIAIFSVLDAPFVSVAAAAALAQRTVPRAFVAFVEDTVCSPLLQ